MIKTEMSCIFCGNTEKLINYQGKKICDKCMIDITRITLTSVEKAYMERNRNEILKIK